MNSLIKKDLPESSAIDRLKAEINTIETAMFIAKREVDDFSRIIHSKLDLLISQMSRLNSIVKAKKQEKKAKRLEQKKRGKNYVEPVQLKPLQSNFKQSLILDEKGQQELRRLYKQAVVQVHPDKISHGGELDKIQHATSLTAQLNLIYKSGDLEELLDFYHQVILGNPLPETSLEAFPVIDPQLRLAALKQKKSLLEKQLKQLQSTYLYQVLHTYEDPLLFIKELHLQFQEKIQKLEKRAK